MEENKNIENTEEVTEKKQCGKCTDEDGKEKCRDKKKSKSEKTEELEARIAELEEKLKEAEDRHLRMAAEYDNFRRRSREEKEATYNTALSNTVAELLPIIDNLERAGEFDNPEKVREGLKMIFSSAEGALAKLGVESYGKVGEEFDPNLHHAIMHDEDDSERKNEIDAVFQKGYKKGGKIIRFAMVKTVN